MTTEALGQTYTNWGCNPVHREPRPQTIFIIIGFCKDAQDVALLLAYHPLEVEPNRINSNVGPILTSLWGMAFIREVEFGLFSMTRRSVLPSWLTCRKVVSVSDARGVLYTTRNIALIGKGHPCSRRDAYGAQH